MNYKTVNDLSRLLWRGSDRVVRSVDAVVGVPRSGLLAANILALRLNLPLTDVDGLCEGRLFQSGARGTKTTFEDINRVLVVDDSLCRGSAMQAVRQRIEAAEIPCEVKYSAVYVAPGAEQHVDLYWEKCELPRVFEWNVLHHSTLSMACVDIDGVLCRDPTPDENDDGIRYIEFMRGVQPLVQPTGVIDTLVTCRLEKYRATTEQWLTASGIKYRRLIMLDLPDAESRKQWGKHGEYKGEVFRNSDNALFIESDVNQAIRISHIAARPVLATDVNQMILPGFTACAAAVRRKTTGMLHARSKSLTRWLSRRLYPKSFGAC